MRTKVLILAVLLFATFGFKCGDSGNTGGNTAENPCAAKPSPWNCSYSVNIPWDGPHNVNDHIITTPGGVTVRSVVDIPMQAQLAIDQAAQADINTYAQVFPQWGQISMSELQVFVIDPDHFSAPDGDDPGGGLLNVWYTKSTRNGLPTRDVASSAGNCIGCPGSGIIIYPSAVVPHQAGVDPARPTDQPWSHLRLFREAAFNELQHAIECNKDPNGVCKQFATVGDVHPHFGDDIWATDLPAASALAKKAARHVALAPCHAGDLCKPLKTK